MWKKAGTSCCCCCCCFLPILIYWPPTTISGGLFWPLILHTTSSLSLVEVWPIFLEWQLSSSSFGLLAYRRCCCCCCSVIGIVGGIWTWLYWTVTAGQEGIKERKGGDDEFECISCKLGSQNRILMHQLFCILHENDTECHSCHGHV